MRPRWRFCGFVAATLFWGSLARAQELALPSDSAQVIDHRVRALLSQQPVGGVSLAVSFAGAQWMQGYGWAERSSARPATPRTSYRIASVTKTMTGVAIMQLVEQGKVALDAEIHSYLPSYPKKPWPITVRQLLTHLSGTYHYRDQGKEGHFKTHFTTRQALAVFQDWPLAHAPGTKFLYTSYGYNVLGAIVEAASGQSFGDYLQEHIFSVAGMTRSGLEQRHALDEDSAIGYQLRHGQLKPSEVIDISSRFAGGGVRSTVQDLILYGQALMEGRLLRAETWEAVQTPGRTQDGHWVDYGLGFGVFPQHGHLVLSHLGSQPETTSLLLLVPKQRLAIAVATNVENQSALLSSIAETVVETLLERGVKRRPLYADDRVDQLVLEGMTRVYSYGWARVEGWGGALGASSLPSAAQGLGQLLSRETIAADPNSAKSALAEAHHPAKGAWLPLVGEAMAQVLTDEYGAAAAEKYWVEGPIAFFSDYLDACTRRECPVQWPDSVRQDVQWMRLQWTLAGAPLNAVRTDDVESAAALQEALEPLVSRAAIHPDFTPELTRTAARFQNAGRLEEALATVELASRLHPFSREAQLTLADALLLKGEEAQAQRLYVEHGLHGEAAHKRAAMLEQSPHPRAAQAAAWLKRFALPSEP